MSSNKLKVAVIGAGGISRAVHLPGWKKINEAEVTAIVDVNPDAAKAAAGEFCIPKVYTDYREMLKSEDIDIVDICIPNRQHTPVTIAALESGAHVLCEKPLAVSSAEVRQMGELADQKGLKLMTAQHQRFQPSSGAIKQWAATGALGEVYHARVRAMRRAWLPPSPGFIDSRLSGGGPCMDIGVHALDTCLWIMGFPKPVRVTGSMKTNFAKGHTIPGKWGEWDRSLFDVEDFASGFIHFENGATMTLEAAWLGHQEEDEDVSFQLFGKGAGVQWPSGRYSSVINGAFCQGSLSPVKTGIIAHHEEIRAFVNCVANSEPSPVPWTETIRVIATLEAIDTSSKLGHEVEVSF
jgi:predicted dehydrogenase